MKVMLDTNICIYIIKQKPQTVLERFRAFQVGDVGISSITLAELQYGAMKSARPQAEPRKSEAIYRARWTWRRSTQRPPKPMGR